MPLAVGDFKVCGNRKCAITGAQPVASFSKNSSTKDKLQKRCKKCQREYDRLRSQDPERRKRKLERMRLWHQKPEISQDPERKKRARERARLWHQKPEIKERQRLLRQERWRLLCQNPEAKKRETERLLLYHQNPESRKRQAEYSFRRKYGISRQDKRNMWAHNRGLCACCGDQLPFEKANTDHIHGTKIVRGILCRPCNYLLGFAKDDPERCYKAAAYLERFQPYVLPRAA
jgi:Recombination endonuclease VII